LSHAKCNTPSKEYFEKRASKKSVSLKSHSKKSGIYQRIFPIFFNVFFDEFARLSIKTVLYQACSKATTA
jgi:hypothetical protein